MENRRDPNLNADVLLENMGSLATHHDLTGLICEYTSSLALENYFLTRLDGRWRMDEYRKLCPNFLKYGDLLSSCRILLFVKTDDVEGTLGIKSALAFLAEDFPEMADTFLYSTLMEQMDEHIAAWPSKRAPFVNYKAYSDAKEYLEDYKGALSSHIWWTKAVNECEFIQGETIDEARAKFLKGKPQEQYHHN